MANNPTTNANKKLKHHRNQDSEEVEGDPEVWATFDKSFKQVQSVLDRNRVLIQQVNENHQSKIPDNMVKNVALIQELNGNISKVVSLYSDLSSNFSTMFHHKNGDDPKNGGVPREG
ncbi:protein EARLY FLOWERING 4-like [Durio zibethinus]|uniref:Protein EARLY FLOWERING 4-like n=1 Tax=Durio zibethinus TaxID=66656 RepID=A0A6P6AI52_DURZI|nr:protein EARLY FLOWERING 4-like [Durio zibethinus]